MSSFVTVKCPRCGTEQQLHLGGYGFYDQETTICKLCGREYDSMTHCIEEVPDRDDDIPIKKLQEFPKQAAIDLSKVSTKDLLNEIKRRSKS